MVRREIRMKKKNQNSLAIILVAMVILIMLVVVTANNRGLKEKLETYREKEQILSEQIEAENVQVFAGTVTLQNLEMIPLSELPDKWTKAELFKTPPQNL